MPMTIDDGRAYVALAAYNFHSLRSLIGRSLASGLGGPLRRAFYTAALSLFKTGPQEIQLFFFHSASCTTAFSDSGWSAILLLYMRIKGGKAPCYFISLRTRFFCNSSSINKKHFRDMG